eukprot:scaffold149_cov315-Pinguiococcus_pyrenoidosus.AAC.39
MLSFYDVSLRRSSPGFTLDRPLAAAVFHFLSTRSTRRTPRFHHPALHDAFFGCPSSLPACSAQPKAPTMLRAVLQVLLKAARYRSCAFTTRNAAGSGVHVGSVASTEGSETVKESFALTRQSVECAAVALLELRDAPGVKDKAPRRRLAPETELARAKSPCLCRQSGAFGDSGGGSS